MPYKQYNNNQTNLTFPFEMQIPDDHIVRVISLFVDALALGDWDSVHHATRGRAAYAPRMMLKMLLFAYTRGATSGTQIELLARENIPMKWLIGDPDLVPNARTINRFRTAQATGELIKIVYLQFRQLLTELKMIDDEAVFIDGTKIVADANKYSFVWRKSVERYEPLLDAKANALFDELTASGLDVDTGSDNPDLLARMKAVADGLDQKISALSELIETEKVSAGGSKNKQLRRKLKKYTHLLRNDLIKRKERYQDAHAIFGDRNSFSKTDPDATFMMMKEDPMNNGQTKPGYNLQIATQNQFVLYYDINQRPTDQRTLIPFLKQLDRHFQFVVADAGYGSEANYDFVTSQYQAIPLIPYTMYLKEQSRRYRQDPSKRQNWRYNGVLDRYIDNHGIQFHRISKYNRTDKQTGTVRHFIGYEAIPVEDSERNRWALTEQGNLRQITVNPHWEEQKAAVRKHLADEDQAIIYATRKIEVEPVFGNMKRNLGYMRASVRGLAGVRNEVGLTLMAGNLKKLAILMVLYPDLAQKFLNGRLLCCTLKCPNDRNLVRIDARKQKPAELSRRNRIERSDVFCDFEFCLGHLLYPEN